MNILGLFGAFDWDVSTDDSIWSHDAGATLISNGNHITSISEERLTRIKYYGNFPSKSIEYCLSTGNLSHDDIDLVYVPTMPHAIWHKNVYEGKTQSQIQTLFPNCKIKFVSHHLCHAASSVFSCDFNEGTFITLDGRGGSLCRYNFEEINNVETNSIGYFNKEKGIFRFFPGLENVNEFGNYYFSFAHVIYSQKMKKQFPLKDAISHSGKIMGLSAYGKNESYRKEHDGYQLSKDLYCNSVPYVTFDFRSYDEQYKFKNLNEHAYILQKNFENALLDYLNELKEKSYLEENICFAGGCFLNVLANSLIQKSGLFNNIHIPPFPGDDGLSFGAACYAAFEHGITVNLPNNIALLGKEYSQDDIEKELKKLL